MMTRWEKMVCWAALPVGLLVAFLAAWMAGSYWAQDTVRSFFYGFLAFLGVQLAVALWLGARAANANEIPSPVTRIHGTGPRLRSQAAQKCVHIRLSKEASEALREIMAAEEGQSPSLVINYMLIRHQRGLRKSLLDDWQFPHGN